MTMSEADLSGSPSCHQLDGITPLLLILTHLLLRHAAISAWLIATGDPVQVAE